MPHTNTDLGLEEGIFELDEELSKFRIASVERLPGHTAPQDYDVLHNTAVKTSKPIKIPQANNTRADSAPPAPLQSRNLASPGGIPRPHSVAVPVPLHDALAELNAVLFNFGSLNHVRRSQRGETPPMTYNGSDIARPTTARPTANVGGASSPWAIPGALPRQRF